MWSFISALMQAIASGLGIWQQKDAQKNATDVKQAQKDQDSADQVKKFEDEVAKGDIDEIRKDAAGQ